MIFRNENCKNAVLGCALGLVLLAGLTYAGTPGSPQITADQKSKVSGTIASRTGDLVKVKDKKSGQTVVLSITDNTKIERKKGKAEFFRHKDMDVTAMVPGLTIEAEGVGNAKGQLVASKITFIPDEFAVEVAEEQQIMANKAATANAQSTANQGVAAASQAQSSAKTVAEAGIYFPSDMATLDDAAKADLDLVAAATKGVDGYLIEIAGYASSTGTKQLNQKLSEERAAAVANYLLQKGNVPMRRIIAPAGYGATHPSATNTDSQGRALNRRVDVTVIVNKGLAEGI